MKISLVTIRDIMGIRELEFKPGAGFTEIVGKNGLGKTSVLEAIKSIVKGGHDATLLRDGAEKGEIVLVLDDNTEIKKTVRAHTSNVEIKRDGKRQARPAELIRSLADQLSTNPVEFLTAKEDDRVSIFLQSVPLKVDAAYLKQITGVEVEGADRLHAYQVLETVHDQVYDDRTGTNRAIDEKEKTMRQLRQAMPDAPAGVVGGEEELEAKLTQLDTQKDTSLEDVRTKLQTFVDQMNEQIATVSREKDEKIEELQRQIDTLRSDKVAAVEVLRSRITSVTAKAEAKRTEIRTTNAADRQPIETQLAVLRTNRNAAAKREQTLETITTMEAELEQLRQDAARQNKALDDIDRYKSDLLKTLPIPGMEVRSGKIYRDNVVFDRLNTQQRVDIAVDIAKLRAGELGVVCVDGIECMDADMFETFRTRALQSGLQFVVSHVTNGPFNIKTNDPF